MTPNNQKVIDGQPAPTSPGLSFLPGEPGTIFTARKKDDERTHTLEKAWSLLMRVGSLHIQIPDHPFRAPVGILRSRLLRLLSSIMTPMPPGHDFWFSLLQQLFTRIQAAGLPGPGPGPKEARPRCDFGCLSGRAAQGTGSSHSCVSCLLIAIRPYLRHSFGVHPKPDTPDCQLRYGKTRTRGPKKQHLLLQLLL